MKLIVEINNLKEITKFNKLKNISYLMVGLTGFSLCSPIELSVQEINNLAEKQDNLIINIERLLTDEELDKLKQELLKLNLSKIAYFVYSDLGVNTLFNELNIQNKLIYRSSTYMTNINDFNLYQEFNQYVTISSEISFEEMNKIAENAKHPAIIDFFGQNVIFYSRRELIKNYFDYRKMDNDPFKSTYKILEEMREEAYPIREYTNYTVVFEPKHYLLDNEYAKGKISQNVEYGFVHTNNLNMKQTIELANLLNNFLTNLDMHELHLGLQDADILTYKGAYDINSCLLKKGVCNE